MSTGTGTFQNNNAAVRFWINHAPKLNLFLLILVLLCLAGIQGVAAQGPPPIVWMGGGHAIRINTVSAASDGTIWSAGGDLTVKHWRPSDGRLLETVTFADYYSAEGGFSEDGQRVALLNNGGGISVYQLPQGNLLQSFSGGIYGVSNPVLSGNGATLVYNNSGSYVVIGDVATGNTISFGCTNCSSLTISRDGKIIALGSYGDSTNATYLYDASNGTLIRTLTGHTMYISSVAFSPDKALLASASADGTVQIWRLSDFLLLQTIKPKNHEVMNSLAFSPDSSLLATADLTSNGDKQVSQLWKVSNGALLATIPGNFTCIYPGGIQEHCLDFTSSDKWLVTANTDPTLRFWSVPKGKPSPFQPGHTAQVNAVAYSPNGRLAASASQDQTIKVWDNTKGTVVATLTGHTGSVNGVGFSPDGKWLATASSDTTIKIWDTTKFSLVRTLSGHTQPVMALAFSPDGSLLASGSAAPEQEVWLWNVSNWKKIRSLTGSAGGIASVAFLGNGEVAAGSLAGIARLWDVKNGTIVQSYLAPSNGAMTLSFSPNHKVLAAGWTSQILLFKVTHDLPFNTIDAHAKDGTVVAYSPNGKLLLSGNPDGTVKFWNTSDWSLITYYDQETDAVGPGVINVNFSPSGTKFVYARGDATIVIAKSPR